MKIFHKFNLIIIGVIVLVVSIYSFYNIRHEQRSLVDEMIGQAGYFSKTVALGINSTSYLDRRDLLVDYLDQMVPSSNGWMLYGTVTNLNNYVWISTDHDLEYKVLEDPVSEAISRGIDKTNPLVQTYYDGRLHEKVLDVASLITVGMQDRGIMRLGFSFRNVEKKISDAIFKSVITGLIAIIIGIIVSTITAKAITTPISQIVQRSREVSNGNLGVSISTGSNITEIKVLEKSIEQMKRDLRYAYLGGIFADFHHSIKSDLGLITANIEYIRKHAGSEENVDMIDTKASQIMDRIDYINAEVNKYREYKKPQDVRMSEIDLHDFVKEIAGSINIPPNIELQTKYPEYPVNIYGDAVYLKRAFLNILRNGIDAMPSGGDLFLRVEKKGSSAVVTVRDSGYGIPATDIAKVFDPNYSTKKKRGGEGIGLAITNLIIEEIHGGSIEVQSELGKGTVFSITVPLLKQSRQKGML